jgi:hypothetical protein
MEHLDRLAEIEKNWAEQFRIVEHGGPLDAEWCSQVRDVQ